MVLQQRLDTKRRHFPTGKTDERLKKITYKKPSMHYSLRSTLCKICQTERSNGRGGESSKFNKCGQNYCHANFGDLTNFCSVSML